MSSSTPGDRIELIQTLLDSCGRRHYLEVGVASGETFFRIRAKKKIAVDPKFLFKSWTKIRWIRWNPYNFFSSYHRSTSDAFFLAHSAMLASQGLDVVFVDGLHTYHQSLRDVESSLLYLRDGGFVVIDDCLPPNELAARPTIPHEYHGPWCGDVWKTVVHLRSQRPDLSVFVLDMAFGLGVVTRSPAKAMLDYSPEAIDAMSYEDLRDKAEELLDLRPRESIRTLLSAWQTAGE